MHRRGGTGIASERELALHKVAAPGTVRFSSSRTTGSPPSMQDAGCGFVHPGQEGLDTADITASRKAGLELGVSIHDHAEFE